MKDDALWQRISAIDFNQNAAALDFATRLARDNHWTAEYARGVIDEYRRFAYLACVAGHEVTPSDEVDQAWHLHLVYSRHYWGDWTQALGIRLHHGPTSGGSRENARYLSNYNNTLASYRHEFGHAPPAAFWPDAVQRFSRAPYFARVNHKTHWVVSKSRLRRWAITALSVGGALSLLVPFRASAQAEEDSGSLGGTIFLALLAIGIGAMLVMAVRSKRRSKKDNVTESGTTGFVGGCGGAGSRGDSSGNSGGDGGGGGASGCGGGGCGGGS